MKPAAACLALLVGLCTLATAPPAEAMSCNKCLQSGVGASAAGWDVSGFIDDSVSSQANEGSDSIGSASASSGRAGGASPNAPLIEYDYRSTCDIPGGDGGCAGGTLQCLAQDAESVFVAQRQVAPTVGAWSLQPGSVCLTPQQQLPWSPAQLQAFVDGYFQRLPLPLPGLELQPGDRAVVNLPLIASTEPPQQTTFTVTQAPFPTITITATVSWRWSWGDGESTTTSWPGRAYDGTDPRSSPGHYVSHPYAAPSAGTTIGVTAVWSGRYSIAGAGEQAINGTVERASSRTIPVSEYGATLTDN